MISLSLSWITNIEIFLNKAISYFWCSTFWGNNEKLMLSSLRQLHLKKKEEASDSLCLSNFVF